MKKLTVDYTPHVVRRVTIEVPDDVDEKSISTRMTGTRKSRTRSNAAKGMSWNPSAITTLTS